MPDQPHAGEDRSQPSCEGEHAAAIDATRRLNEIGQLAAGVGHNVINAFSAVVSHAELLRLASESGREIDPKPIAEIVIKAAMDASGVARRLIDFSRSATVVDKAPLALDAFLSSVADHYRREGRHPEVDWVVDVRPVPLIAASEVQLRAMLGHLIQNALEAMPPGGGTIRIRLDVDDRGWILIDVADNGSGMAPDVAEHAVEPFFTTKSRRLGVGLSIAHGIWRRHHGTLAVRSRPGQGTTIRLGIQPPRDGSDLGRP
jgi:signal transduction histidine kinase